MVKIFVSSKSFKKSNYAMKQLGEVFDITTDISEADGLIAGTEKIDASILKNAIVLKCISRFGVGVDNIDMEYCELRGIEVYANRYSVSNGVAELTLGLMLDVSRRISEADRSIRAGGWQQMVGRSLFGKKLGIIGLGKIGRAVFDLVKPFSMNVLAYDVDDRARMWRDVKMVDLETLVRESDIISLHVPLTKNNRHMVDAELLSKMKKDVILINTSRGGLIDEEALLDSLILRNIGGAGLDVFDNEPYDGRLKNYNNVVMTCHMGSASEETRKNMVDETIENLESELYGK